MLRWPIDHTVQFWNMFGDQDCPSSRLVMTGLQCCQNEVHQLINILVVDADAVDMC